MRATLRDPTLLSHAGRFVWLALNFDEPANEVFFKRHDSNGVLPVFFVIDPLTERTERVQYGGSTATEFKRFLDEDARSDADKALQHGDAVIGSGHPKEAAAAYQEALRLGGGAWPKHDHALEQLVIAFYEAGSYESCSNLAFHEAKSMSRSHAFINVAQVGLNCATAAKDDHVEVLEALAREASQLPVALEDDRFEIYNSLIAARRLRADVNGVRILAEEYLLFMEQRPPPKNDDERSARDTARLRAALELSAPQRVIAALEESDRVLVDSNSAARLGKAYLAAGLWEKAASAISRGLRRAPGPLLEARMLATRAAAEAKLGNAAAAKRDLVAGLRDADHVATVPARAEIKKRLKDQLDGLP